MDYDENDFQSQNQHLAGEGNSKFSPVLQPYALSKFDFDESLQGHLRFDGLVESEVFLGIAHNVDNQWIEDFSRGSGGIEFNTCATESCSISRHNNVWSEATSSESVEMLLKSVGQEEVIPNQSTIKAPDACDPGSLTKQMEPNLTHDDIVFSKSGDAGSQHSALTSDEILQNSSGVKEAVLGEQYHVEFTLQTQGESSGGGKSGELDPNALDVKYVSSNAEEALFANEESVNKIEGQVHTLYSKSLDDKAQENVSALQIKADKSVGGPDNVVISCDRMENQIILSQANDVNVEKVDGLQTESSQQGEEHLAMSLEKSNSQNPVDDAAQNSVSNVADSDCFASQEQNKEEGNAVGNALLEPLMEGCSGEAARATAAQAIKCVDTVSNKDAAIGGQLEVASEKDEVAEEPAVEVCKSVVEDCTVSEQTTSEQEMPLQTSNVDKKDSLSDQGQRLLVESSAELLFEKGNEVIPGKIGEEIDGGSSFTMVSSLVGPNKETKPSDASKGATCEINQEDVNAQSGVQPSASVEIEEVCRESEPGDIPKPEQVDSGHFSLPLGDNDENDGVPKLKETQESSGPELKSMASKKGDECEVGISTDAGSAIAEQQSLLTVSQAGPVSDAGTEENCNGSQKAVLTEKVEAEAGLDFSKSAKTKGDHIEVIPEEPGEMTSERNHEEGLKNSGNVSKVSESISKPSPLAECHVTACAMQDDINNADGSKADCSSPTVIRGAELSEDVNMKEADKDSYQKFSSSDAKDTTLVLDQEGTDADKDGKSFTFDVSALKGKDASKQWQPFSAGEVSKVSPTVGRSPSTSAVGQAENKLLADTSIRSPPKSRETARGRAKDTTERKPRRASGKASGKESVKKGNLAKETAALKQSDMGGSSYRSLSPSGIYQVVQSADVQQYGQVDGSNSKHFGVLGPATSSLPDLNTSAFPNLIFQQPFTDLQQVQLRAQIFVYGSLISKLVPEEAHMCSAFGGADGGRSMWENAWRACRERLLGQTVLPANAETPSQSRSASDQATKQSLHQNKVSPSPVGRVSSMSTPASVNPVLPLSSPVWNISTPYDSLQTMPKGAGRDYQHAFSPVHLNQTPPLGNYFGHSTSWMSQTPFRGTWTASPQTSVLDPNIRFSSLPMTEAAKLVPVKESPVSLPSAANIVAASPATHDRARTNFLLGSSIASLDPKNVAVSPGQPSTDPKPRKRKKVSTAGDLGQITSQAPSQVELGPISATAGHHLASIPAATSAGSASHHLAPVPPATSAVFLPETSMAKLNTSVLPPTSIPLGNKAGEQDKNSLRNSKASLPEKKKNALPEESISKVQEARQQAQDAASLAAAAIAHSQEIWNQLNKQKDSGLIAAAEVKLASAAVAAAAAASVAKAAAAAANVASNAALQAKLMAEEAVNPISHGNNIPNDKFSFPSSGAVKTSSSMIVAAKEAAKRRIEAASAASLRAENLDAIVKAAELAAEAITQAGKVVAMGDPLPLAELAEAGPDGFWKMPQVSSSQVAELQTGNMEKLNGDNALTVQDASGKDLAGPSHDKEVSGMQCALPPTSGESSKDKVDNGASLIDGVSGLSSTDGKNFRGQKGRRASDLSGAAGGVSVSTFSQNEFGVVMTTSKENSIKEGSHVEVLKDGDGYKAAWFSADVLSLKDGKAYLCYSEIPSNEGSGKLKEWVELGSQEDYPPKVRIAHPMTAIRFEGTRKRRRAAMGDFTCSVGDRVDAWMRDSWWEGVVTEKNQKDGTSVTVHFPAHGETSVVRLWQLRPSLMWKDGEWMEWPSAGENVHSHKEGEMQEQKRAKLGTPGLESRVKDKVPESTAVVESGKLQGVGSLDLTAKDKIFNIGKKNADESKMDRLRTSRTGSRNEGSRVVIGVPKPGKKRKFMEVSKHYVGNQNKMDEVNDSVKLANYLMPQGTGPRGWKNFPKNVKEKQMAESKPNILRSGRTQNFSSRTIAQKSSSTTAVSAVGAGPLGDAGAKSKDSSDHDEHMPEKHNMTEYRSFPYGERAAGGPISSLVPSSDTRSSKRTFTTTAKAERLNRGKVPGGNVTTQDDRTSNNNATKSTSEVVEPRRSNRRIQPTSRLLEGLQSSMTISKMPSASHDRGHRSQNKGAGKRD